MDWQYPRSEWFVFVLLVLLGAVALAIQLWWVNGKRLSASPGTVFLLMQMLFWGGTVLAVDPTRQSDLDWLAVVSGGMLCFAGGGALANFAKRFRPREEIAAFASAPVVYDLGSRSISLGIYGAAALCVVVGVVYGLAVGYNVFFAALREFLTAGILDPFTYNSLRVSVSGERYVASGYAAQFIAILLPSILCLLYFRVRQQRRLLDRSCLLALCLVDIWFLTVSGARAGLVFAVVGFLFLISAAGPLPRIWRANTKLFWVLLLTAAGFYLLTAALMGRSGESGDVGQLVRGGFQELYERTMGNEAEDHLELMEYLLYQSPRMGTEWWRDLKEVVPGAHKEFTSGVEMYALLHGGDTGGSMGLTIWGSFVYNWGTAASFVLALATGFLFQRFWIAVVRGPRTLSRIVLLFLAGFRLTVVRDPYSLLLQGFFTIIGFYLVLRLLQRRLAYTRNIPLRIASRHWGAHARPSPRQGMLVVENRDSASIR